MELRNKLFWTLFIMSIISIILILPYAFTLQNEIISKANLPLPIIVLVSIIQSAILFAIFTFFGLKLAKKTGFKLPLLESWLNNKNIDYSKTLRISIISGLLVGIIIAVLDRFVFQGLLFTSEPPAWQGLLASFYGGIAEEIVMRLFLMTLIIFILMKLFKKNKPTSFIVWFSIIFVAVIFGLGHLPITSAITQITPMIVIRAIVLNGIGGIVFGWLYYKKGLESAMISHFSADIILHFIVPLLFLI